MTVIRITMTIPERVAAKLAQEDPGPVGCRFCLMYPEGHEDDCIWKLAYEWWFAPAKAGELS